MVKLLVLRSKATHMFGNINITPLTQPFLTDDEQLSEYLYTNHEKERKHGADRTLTDYTNTDFTQFAV